jgi:uncharacterized protein
LKATDHAGLEVLSYAECVERLKFSEVGRIAFLADGDIQIFPVNFRWHHGAIVFRTAPGTKLDAAWFKKVCAFEVDGWDSVHQSGWSVVAKGLAKVVDTTEDLEALGLRPWAGPGRDDWVRIRPDEVTGRKIL